MIGVNINGIVVFNVDNQVDYVLDVGFCGEVIFDYEICDVDGCFFVMVIVNVFCFVDYLEYLIGMVIIIDVDGVVDFFGVICVLCGVVYGVNFCLEGLQFIIIDEVGDGIGVFSGN